MRENGTDRDVALQLLDALTNINTQIHDIKDHLYSPYILVQPEDVYDAVIASYIDFTVEAANVETYQWQYKSKASGGWEDSQLTGYNTKTITIQVTELRYLSAYRCKLTSKDGTVVYTNEVKMYAPKT